MPFDIIVIGSGIAGSATAVALSKKGHNVHVLEQKPVLSEFGAGLQVTPNGVRCAAGWGLKEQLEKYALKPDAIVIKRFDDASVINRRPHNLKNLSEIEYGEPHYFMHRPDLQNVLATAAVEAGAKITFDARIDSVDTDAVKVVLSDGRTFEADLIVGADGVKSKVRSFIPENKGLEPIPYPEATYRVTLTRERMMSTPETAEIMQTPQATAWVGPSRWALTYPISRGELFNVALPVEEFDAAIPIGAWNVPANIDQLRAAYKDFAPDLQKIIGLVDEAAKWVTSYLPALRTWTSSNGRIVLVGDAAHAMCPHIAQGATVSIEDAAALAECVSWAKTRSDLKRATAAFEAIRKPRCERVQQAAYVNGEELSTKDENVRRDRDARWTKVKEYQEWRLSLSDEESRAIPPPELDPNGRYMDPGFMQWLYAYDAFESAREYMSKLV